MKDHKINNFKVIALLLVFGVLILCVAASMSPEAKAASNKNKYSYKLQTKVKADVRKSAAKKAKLVTTIKPGKTIYADKLTKNKWFRFKYKGKYVYVSKSKVITKRTIVKYSPQIKMRATNTVNIRKSPDVKSKKLGQLAQNKTFKATGSYKLRGKDKWHTFKYKGKKAYLMAKYAKIVKASTIKKQEAVETESNKDELTADEQYLKTLEEEGFTGSYRKLLLKLHKNHPNWIFRAKKVNYTWKKLNTAARVVGRNLIDSTVTKKWRSTSSKVYNKSTGYWTTFDGGRWYQAKNSVITYYLDPRNFLNEDSIYQFMTHSFSSNSQSESTVKKLASYVSYSFLNTSDYISTIYKAGKNGKVNPNVLTAMIIEEQGWYGGSGLISGNTPGYKGYYNFFNIGAYTANGMTATQRGLWYAKGAGIGATSYGRPWNSKYKAILGGALFYSDTYVTKKQYNYYSKKFNVFNGESALGTHEYMTNVMGADEEARLVKIAYGKKNNKAIKFYIPVYKDMPEAPCKKPAV